MNEVQAELKVYILQQTEMGVNEFITKFNEGNIINMKMEITLSDGSVHQTQLCELLDGVIKSFIVNGEEQIEEDINKTEKIAKLSDLAINKSVDMYKNNITYKR